MLLFLKPIVLIPTMMRILIFGTTGQVASELGRLRWPESFDVKQVGRREADLIDAEAVSKTVYAARPEIVINAAAYTAVDRAETESEAAAKINRDAPAAMASACQQLGAALVQVSTDYVFDGSKSGPYLEHDRVSPLSVYGRTKAEGEAAIRNELARHVIIRTSWVFAACGTNFVRTMLRLADERPELRIVRDQQGAPTAARDIAEAIAVVAGRIRDGSEIWGTFHFAGTEPTTWFDFARAIFELSRKCPHLIPIATADYLTVARRPLNSVLDCRLIEREYAIRQPSWRKALVGVLKELGAIQPLAGSTVE